MGQGREPTTSSGTVENWRRVANRGVRFLGQGSLGSLTAHHGETQGVPNCPHRGRSRNLGSLYPNPPWLRTRPSPMRSGDPVSKHFLARQPTASIIHFIYEPKITNEIAYQNIYKLLLLLFIVIYELLLFIIIFFIKLFSCYQHFYIIIYCIEKNKRE